MYFHNNVGQKISHIGTLQKGMQEKTGTILSEENIE